jgi:hypothetical protein
MFLLLFSIGPFITHGDQVKKVIDPVTLDLSIFFILSVAHGSKENVIAIILKPKFV